MDLDNSSIRNFWNLRLWKFFRTAPDVVSDKVLKLQKAGKMQMLIDAIERHKKGLPQQPPVMVKKVGDISSDEAGS